MKKTFILFFLIFFISNSSLAQFKLFATTGLASTLNNKQDSVSFAKKNGIFLNINPSFYWGRIGLGLKASMLNHTPQEGFGLNKPPQIDSFRLPDTKGGGLRSSAILLGPEICLCSKKLKIMPTIKAGIVINKMKSVELLLQSTVVNRFYSTSLDEPTCFAINAGANVTYKVSSKLGIGFNVDYLGYKIKTIIRDYRITTGTKKIAQSKQLLNMGLGIYANF